MMIVAGNRKFGRATVKKKWVSGEEEREDKGKKKKKKKNKESGKKFVKKIYLK